MESNQIKGNQTISFTLSLSDPSSVPFCGVCRVSSGSNAGEKILNFFYFILHWKDSKRLWVYAGNLLTNPIPDSAKSWMEFNLLFDPGFTCSRRRLETLLSPLSVTHVLSLVCCSCVVDLSCSFWENSNLSSNLPYWATIFQTPGFPLYCVTQTWSWLLSVTFFVFSSKTDHLLTHTHQLHIKNLISSPFTHQTCFI